MVTFISEKINEHITRIYEFSGVQMYLVEGRAGAVLIDTGSGVGALKEFVSTLTSLPITVLITHGHVDHAMGAAAFDRVCMSHKDKLIFQNHSSLDMKKAYLSLYPGFSQVEEDDYQPVPDFDKFLDLADGDCFDLGGIRIEAVTCPGHSPGSTMFLLPELEILITGDACNYFTMLQDFSSLSITEYQKNLISVNERLTGKFYKILISHGKGDLEIPSRLLENVIKVCDDVKNRADDRISFDFMGSSGFVAKAYYKEGALQHMRVDGGFGNIVYRADKI